MPYRAYGPPDPRLFGYDPAVDLPPDHLARLVEQVVESAVRPPLRPRGKGQPPFDPRLPLKVLLYGYATGVRSSRRLEECCGESLPFLFLTRGDTPSYRTLCSVRVTHAAQLEAVFVALFAVAEQLGLRRVGRLVLDSTKVRAAASPEAVLKAAEYAPVRAELARILEEARRLDEQEEREQPRSTTRLGQAVETEQLRAILRRVRAQLHDPPAAASEAPATERDPPGEDPPATPPSLGDTPPAAGPAPGGAGNAAGSPPPRHTPQMLVRLRAALAALDAAVAQGRKHLCLTDPAARMMGEGRLRNLRACHSWQVAVDQGLLVGSFTTQAGNDNALLLPLVAAASAHEPEGVEAVDADSGYYGGDAVAALLTAGIDPCIPTAETAADLHRGLPVGTHRRRKQRPVPLTYHAAPDEFRCPEGNRLPLRQQRPHHAQHVKVYVAAAECTPCPQAAACLVQPGAKRRTVKVGQHQAVLAAEQARFAEPEHQARYRRRGSVVETVFGFLRGTLGYHGWLLRGAERVACEGQLFTLAYQFRKVHARWATAA